MDKPSSDTALKQAESLYNTGISYFQTGSLEVAMPYFRKVLEIIPAHSYSFYFIGLIFREKGDNQQAIANLRQAIKYNSKDPDFHNCLGLIFASKDKIELAIESFKKAISLDPGNSEYYNNLGSVFYNAKRLNEAVENYSEAVRLEKNNHEFLNNLGVALDENWQQEEAVTVLSRAISLAPRNPEYYNNLGLALTHLKTQKIIDYMNYLEDTSEDPEFYYIPPQELRKRLESAAGNFLKAISFNPDNADYYNNLGTALQRNEYLGRAKENYLKAIKLSPGNGKYYNNLATVFDETGNYKEAIKNYRKALELNPENKEVFQNLSLLFLLQKKFKQGWENFELYRKERHNKKRILDFYDKPEWQGEDLKGKTIYVCWEQGLGDTLQFVRYLPFIKAMGAKVIFNCQPELVNILRATEGFTEIVSKPITEIGTNFDCFISLMSLCRIFTPGFKEIPANVPYIFPPPEFIKKWHGKFSLEKRLKIGFVWRSKFSNSTFKKRSCPVEKFIELAEAFPYFMFYSMQKSPFENEINRFTLPNLVSLSPEINDFSDSAAILGQIDLVISVDTSVTHLAGAMAKNVWNLIPFSPDWRWFLNSSKSPWYPTMTLFRQLKPGDWDTVFKKVANSLMQFVSQKEET